MLLLHWGQMEFLLNKNNDAMVDEDGVLYFNDTTLTVDDNGILQ